MVVTMPDLSYRMLHIAGVPAGLLGLDELFEALFEDGQTPESPETQQNLLKGVRKHNFIPKPALDDYGTVLLREYRRYFRDRTSGGSGAGRDYGQWQGYPREQIPWFPTVSLDLCTACGKCIEVCPKDVFEALEDGKVEVVEPFLCIVGCCMCKGACDPHAILMPERSMLDQYRHGQRHAS